MKKMFLILIVMCLIPTVSALEFTQNTTFNQGGINFHFVKGVQVESFEIVSDGIVINDNHKLIFVVPGGELDVTFYEWTPTSNIIGLQGDAEQDLVFKITVDNVKKYLKTTNEKYYINSIPIYDKEINVSYVKYFESETSDTISRTIVRDKWYQAKIIEFEYNVVKDNNGVIHSETFGFTYVFLVLILLLIGILFWVVGR